MVLWFYVQEHPKAQPAVVLILKRLRRRNHGLKFRPTDWRKPGSNLRSMDHKAKQHFLWLFHGYLPVPGREGLWFVCVSI